METVFCENVNKKNWFGSAEWSYVAGNSKFVCMVAFTGQQVMLFRNSTGSEALSDANAFLWQSTMDPGESFQREELFTFSLEALK